MIRKSRRNGMMVLAVIFSLSAVFLLCHGCGGGGGGSDSGTTPPPTKSVVITGTVPGTVAIAYNKATGEEEARDVASGTPKTFSLNVVPGDYYLMFIENEGTPTQTIFSFQNVTGGNVFSCQDNTNLDLGIINFDNVTKIAKPQTNPLSGTTVTETVTPPADFSGAWISTFKFVDSTCSSQPPGTMKTANVIITQENIFVTLTSADFSDVFTGVANVNTIKLSEFWQSAPYSAVLTMDLTKQSNGSLAGTYSKVGFGGECSNSGTVSAVRSTPGTSTYDIRDYGSLRVGDYSIRLDGFRQIIDHIETLDGITVTATYMISPGNLGFEELWAFDTADGKQKLYGIREGVSPDGTMGVLYKIDPPVVAGTSSMKIGDTFPNTYKKIHAITGAISQPYTLNFTFAGIETVPTPAGTFTDCLKYTVQRDEGTSTGWLAKGIGMVKETQNGKENPAVYIYSNGVEYGTKP